jgi:cellulose synthase/poly-beta-1,6-N-acetylglucosamine synthase-like glycosyltransferase
MLAGEVARASSFWDFQVAVPDWDDVRAFFPLAVAGLIVWSLWVYRVVLSRRYRPVDNDFRTTTSVVVPSFHEDVPILLRCLRSWLDQDPTEVIIVLDVADTEAYDEITRMGDPRVRPIMFRHAGKRSALGVGIKAARCEILVLTDSDTSWQPGLLAAVQMPFVDPEVGAVGTQQNVWERTTNIWRRIADWLVNLRYYDYVPAMGRAGAVACVSGRTGAYRRSVVLPVLENLENEFFLGRRCVAGDDGRLTWLVLGSGYKTVHQSSARALSMFPAGMRAFMKQRIRWSRNSYRCYLTAIYKGWLWRVPFVTKITVLQILLTPVTMGVTIGYLVFSRLELTSTGIVLTLVWLLLGRGIRGFSHLRRHPQEILLLPLLALVVITIALPIKLYAFVTMNKQGWLTRHADSVGGEGQTSADVNKRVSKRGSVAVPTPETVSAAAPIAIPAGRAPAGPGGAVPVVPGAGRPGTPVPAAAAVAGPTVKVRPAPTVDSLTVPMRARPPAAEAPGRVAPLTPEATVRVAPLTPEVPIRVGPPAPDDTAQPTARMTARPTTPPPRRIPLRERARHNRDEEKQ